MSELIDEYINTVISCMRDNFETFTGPELEESDRDEFLDLMKLNIYDKSIDNFMEYHDPVLTEEQFNEMAQHLHSIDLSKVVEFDDNTALMDQAACAGGACEIV